MRILRLATVVLLTMVACDRAPAPGPAGSAPSAAPSRAAGEPTVAPSPDRSAGSSAEVSDNGEDPTPGRAFVVWTPGGLTDGASSQLLEIPGVLSATEVTGGLIWMSESTSGDSPVGDYKIPVEIAFVDPAALGHVFPGAPGFNFRGRDLIFSRTGAALRGGIGGGFRLIADLGNFSGRCCIDDRSAMGYEAVAIGAPPSGWGTSYALVRSTRKPTLRDVRRAVGAGLWRVRNHEGTNFLRYADAVLPQMLLKERFGEFSAIPSSDGSISIEPRWVQRNIVEAKVPILGQVECHRALFDQMRAALAAIEEAGLAKLIKKDEYAGCFNARFIGSDPSGRISSHAWGAGFDIAARSNPLGAPPTLDLRIADRFKDEGLNWGGHWLVPDGMHFEWARART